MARINTSKQQFGITPKPPLYASISNPIPEDTFLLGVTFLLLRNYLVATTPLLFRYFTTTQPLLHHH